MLKLVADNKRKKDIEGDNQISIAHELRSRILSLEEELDNTAVYIRYLSTVNYEEKLPNSIVQKAVNLNFNVLLPDIYGELGKYYVSDSAVYGQDEFLPVNHAISLFVNELLTKYGIYKERDDFLDNISIGLNDLYPDPNLFIVDYKMFRKMQEHDKKEEIPGLWFATIANYGNMYSLKKKLEETMELRNLCIAENDFVYLSSLDMGIRSELGYK